MGSYEFDSLDNLIIGMSKEILSKGIPRKIISKVGEGDEYCLELPHPVIITLTNPCNRFVTIKERKWNKHLFWVESLWLASGTNHMEMAGSYVKNLANYSDDGEYMRAGYGTRMRNFTGVGDDYKRSEMNQPSVFDNCIEIDQLKYVIDTLKKDINSRQALITIHDPAKDCRELDGLLKVTKDQPCSRSLHFMVVNGKLDLTTYMRSNDIMWGLSAVNISNFTFIQEYVSIILGVPVGNYHHFVANLHVYSPFINKIEEFAKMEYKQPPKNYYYDDSFDLEEFDRNVKLLMKLEKEFRTENIYITSTFKHKLFQDWYMCIKNFHTKNKYDYNNPMLNSIMNKEK